VNEHRCSAVVVADGGCDLTTRPPAAIATNHGKRLVIVAGGKQWARVPVRTALFERGDDLTTKVTGYVGQATNRIVSDRRTADALFDRSWYAVVSEKVVAISQGRSYFTWEIRTGLPARILSRCVHRPSYGIGLGCPSTMQLAIDEVGLPRILLASSASVVGKLLGRRGDFYRVAGHRVNAIDGPTPYSAYPSNVSAKLPPKDPELVAARLGATIREQLPEYLTHSFGGTVVIDANDIGREVLGQDTDRPDAFFCELFADNPLGQGRQQTPIAICYEL
jgi:hypothetical protein